MRTVPSFYPGETVDITIRGARVLTHGPSLITIEVAEQTSQLPTLCTEITRVAPQGWAPFTNDVWRDRNGELWIAKVYYAETRFYGPSGDYDCMHVFNEWGPLVLIHREQQDGGERRA